jgi:chloride channel 7
LKWVLAFLVGLITGFIATLINLAIENIAGYKLLAVIHLIQKKRFDDIPLIAISSMLKFIQM